MISRRTFLQAALAPRDVEPVIDVHQHTCYWGRSDDDLIAHQTAMGMTRTVLLPAGSLTTLDVGAGGNKSVMDLARWQPDKFSFFANEVPTLAGARAELEKYLKAGAIGIGEQKFWVECDSPAIHLLADIAADFDVPVLLHFQHGVNNLSIERFHKVLEKQPKTAFIGHAQTWWGNIDLRHEQKIMYPKGPVTAGGLTDRLLADYRNMYGDLSAGSGLNALTRDEAHAREFLTRHQNQLLYGSDCEDRVGAGPACSGAQCLAAVRRLASAEVARKILYGNAARLLKIR
jgi:predicted TIM-barrel fold metal-dependent hydrolase